MELYLTFIILYIFLYMVARLVFKSKAVKLPPGPKPLPIIGNLHQLNGPLPHRTLADLAKKYGPILHLRLGAVPTIIVSSAEVAKQVLNEHDMIFANRPSFLFTEILHYQSQDISFSPNNSSWRNLRKICIMELLSPKRVQSFRQLREDEVMNMVKTVHSKKGSVINMTQMIFSLTYGIISQSAFGKRSKYHDQYIVLMDRIVKMMGGFNLVDLYPSVKVLQTITGLRRTFEKIHEEVDGVLETIVSEHKEKIGRKGESEREDLVDVLVKIQSSGAYGGSISDSNIKGTIYNVFSAGGETSSNTIVWVMKEMMRNPAVLKRAQDEVRKVYGEEGNVDESKLRELKYLEAVIKETLRIRPSAPLLLPRENSEACEINGYQIPAKTRLMVNAFAINRDPNHWEDPDTFNPDRFLEAEIDYQGKNFAYIPFGAGRRICPGISFALPIMELQIAQLLFHFDWELPGKMKNEDLDMTEVFGLTVASKNDLELVPAAVYPLSILAK